MVVDDASAPQEGGAVVLWWWDGASAKGVCLVRLKLFDFCESVTARLSRCDIEYVELFVHGVRSCGLLWCAQYFFQVHRLVVWSPSGKLATEWTLWWSGRTRVNSIVNDAAMP